MAIATTSKCGWLLSACYIAMAGILFYQALTCSGWMCDLVALPTVFPLGFPIAWLIDWIDAWWHIPGHVPTFQLRNGYFILPTVIANAIFYYGLGKLLAILAHRVISKNKSSR
ncbi:hypothetical protein [Halomonas sp. BM-2019]|uniref:hypothetical protein n=1 Tax=Halomonas sp. BM-2019 TaxID=2811227 RepID=UPI001B3C41D8|nr:MAG: hypothetical protein J5F18_06845 [Halomonas sp. BM-2019]